MGFGGEVLSWDSEFFGLRIGRIFASDTGEADFADIRAWRDAEALDCVYFLANSGDARSIRTAESHRLEFVDIRVDLVFSQQHPATPPGTDRLLTRHARECDIPMLRRIARDAHRDSRFYFDERFDPRRVGSLYETWIENSCRGWSNEVIVLEIDGSPAGYATCHLENSIGRIGLFALAESAKGRGLSAELIDAALKWFRATGADRIFVTTQGRNVAAQKAYQRKGFVTDSVSLWYHWWKNAEPDGWDK